MKHITFWASHMKNNCVNIYISEVKTAPPLQEVSAVWTPLTTVTTLQTKQTASADGYSLQLGETWLITIEAYNRLIRYSKMSYKENIIKLSQNSTLLKQKLQLLVKFVTHGWKLSC